LNPVFNMPEQANSLVLSGLKAFNIIPELLNVMEPYLSTPDLVELVNGDEEDFDLRFPLLRD
jgi:hypothetical protein